MTASCLMLWECHLAEVRKVPHVSPSGRRQRAQHGVELLQEGHSMGNVGSRLATGIVTWVNYGTATWCHGSLVSCVVPCVLP